MMATPVDLSLIIREEIIVHLRAMASADITAPVPPTRIYGEQPPSLPVKPFIRYGLVSALPYEHTGRVGSSLRLSLDGFSDEDGSDEIANIGAKLIVYMATFEPIGFDVIENEWTGSTLQRDSNDAASYHVIVEFRFTATKKD